MGSDIESIVVPESVTNMPKSTCYTYSIDQNYSSDYRNTGSQFYNCKNLRTVVINANAPTMDISFFEGCTNLTSVTINSNTLTTIGDMAFKDCTSLTSISIPASVTTFGVDVFAGWSIDQTVYTNKTELQTNVWSVLWNKGCPATIVYGSPVV